MDRIKKVLAALIVMTLVASSFTVGAATQSIKKIKLTNANTSFSVSKLTYNGKNQTPSVKVVYNKKTLKKGTDYIIKVTTVKNAGKYTKTVTVTGIGHYEGAVSKKVTVVVNKAKQTIKTKKKRKVKHKKVKKKSVKIKLKVKSTGNGKLKFKKVTKSKKFKVSKKGKVTIKKGAKKGTYKVKVKAKGNKNYKASKWKKIKIKVK